MIMTKEDMKQLEDKVVNATFVDGCSIDVKIIETMHLDEGGDFGAEVIKVICPNAEHRHPLVGNFINIHLCDLVSVHEPKIESS